MAGAARILLPAPPVALWLIGVGWMTWQGGRDLAGSSTHGMAAPES